MIPVLRNRRYWVCPNCTVEDVTFETIPGIRMHSCPGLHGLTAPLVLKGTKAKVEAKEREDYIGSDDVRLHEGRPVMSVVTTRDDGQDVAVFAPTANGTGAS